MSAHCLLNLLNNLRKRDKTQALLSILSLFCNEVNKFKSVNVRYELSYDIKITFKSHFCHENVILLSLYTQRCYVRPKVSRF